ncbi:MAG: hypothetical protein CFE46_06535 [Burkholderiales bacterium PBB6]|nr:MAG: hypothetical protein CFE46_06535 [Burkholderiales bacterium PBB6]
MSNATLQRAERHLQAGKKALQARHWLQACTEFEQAASLHPGNPRLWLQLAGALAKAGYPERAIDHAQRAVRMAPKDDMARRLLAECLMKMNRHAEAAQVLDEQDAEAPRDFAWHDLHATALFQCKRFNDAIQASFAALSIKMDAPMVHYRLGLIFKDMNMAKESVECFRTASLLDTGSVRALALSLLVHEGRQCCEWSQIEDDTVQLLAALDSADTSTGEQLSPFALLAVDASPAQQRRIGELRTRQLTRHIKPFDKRGARQPGPIRVAYLSGDFHHHATAVLMTQMLEQRDTSRFEVHLFSHNGDDSSATGTRVRAACEQFHDVTHLTSEAIARRMRELDIDIAVDLKGHTRNSRFDLLAFRPAPVQVAFLGYPATSGADFLDYIVGDPVVTPIEHAGHYTECIAQMPHSYQPNDRHRALPPAPSRASLGLPEDAVVLCCFNQTYKISPHMLDLWARVMAGAPTAVLWLLAWNPTAKANLNRELVARGVPPERIFWAGTKQMNDHIARLRQADLFLDTWPCNAHTTASEALWAGVPVLTVPGATYASRVAASLVTACGLPDLAAGDEDSYVALATALANEPETLSGLSEYLEQHRLELPLFDSARYTRDFEAMLVRMFEREQAGEAPTALLASR